MNSFDLNNELARNESDKQLAYAELEASRSKWVDYLIENKNEICTIHHPTVVKKRKCEKFKDFLNKIKIILGLKQKEDKVDGIETYLQYRDSIE